MERGGTFLPPRLFFTMNTIKLFPDTLTLTTLTYASDGENVAGVMVAPKGDGPFPVVIYNRGGHNGFGAIHPPTITGFLADLANAGYLVIASQYRGGPGSTGKDEFGGADLNDVLNLIPIIDTLPNADPKRMGMIGVSRGGMMTYLALTKTDRIKAAITVGGVFDLMRNAQQRPRMADVFKECFGGDTAGMIARSALHRSREAKPLPPMLLLHGDADDRVDYHDAIELATKLPNAKALIVAGGNHCLKNKWDIRMRETFAWLGTHV